MARVSTKEHDYLDSDQSIRGQNYVLLSFISPEDMIEKRTNFLLHSYMNSVFSVLVNQLEDIKSGKVIEAYKKTKENIINFDNCTPEEVAKHNLDYLNVYYKDLASVKLFNENYTGFLMNNEESLGKEFDKANEFRTSMRGVKIRGVYDTLDEAQHRAKQLQTRDPNHNVFLGQVGFWLPWDPKPWTVGDEEYYETELNTLMKEYRKNRDLVNNEWAEELKNTVNQKKNSESEQKIEQQPEEDVVSQTEVINKLFN